VTGDQLLESIKNAPNPEDTMKNFLAELEAANEEIKEPPNILTHLESTIEPLQKAPTVGEWHKRFTECVTSLKEVKNRLLDEMRKFNE